MKAKLLIRRKTELGEGVRVERVLWLLPAPARRSRHTYKYRYALIADDICVLRYDNEAGKGDHKHIGGREEPYLFSSPTALLADLLADVRSWMDANPRD